MAASACKRKSAPTPRGVVARLSVGGSEKRIGPGIRFSRRPPHWRVAVRSTNMDDRRPDQCIERRGFSDCSYFYSVGEYEDAMRRAWHFTSPRAKAFHGLIWTTDGPRVEDLTA